MRGARDTITPMLALKPPECWEMAEKNKVILHVILLESFQAWQKWFWSVRFPSWFTPSKDSIIQMWSQLQSHIPRHGPGFVQSPSGCWALARLSWCCSYQHFLTIYIESALIMWLPSIYPLINEWEILLNIYHDASALYQTPTCNTETLDVLRYLFNTLIWL